MKIGTAYLEIMPDYSGLKKHLPTSSTIGRYTSGLTRAEQTSSKMSRTTGRLGSSLASAARYAAGAAAAYISIAQAKAAVSTTQDLAKTTSGLHNNLGFATKSASKLAAVLKSRGVEGDKAQIAFKALSTQIKAAGDGSTTAKDLFSELGISQRELAKDSHNLGLIMPQIADGLDKVGAGATRTADAQKLFGRGALTLLPILRDGSAAYQDQINTVSQYGAVLSGPALKAQTDLIASQRESKIAWMGLQIQFTKFITPALSTLEDQFQSVARIMADKRLTDDQKFHRIGQIIEKDFSTALDFILAQIPTVASKVGDRAPQIAIALVDGFIHADIWGRLALGALLASKMGLGGAAVRALGRRSGLTFGKGFELGILLSIPLLAPTAFKLGERIGKSIREPVRKIGEGVVNFLIDRLNNVIDMIDKVIDAYNSIPLAPNVGTIGHIGGVDFTGGTGLEALKAYQKELRKVYGLLGGSGISINKQRSLAGQLQSVADIAEKSGADAQRSFTKHLEGIVQSADGHGQKLVSTLGHYLDRQKRDQAGYFQYVNSLTDRSNSRREALLSGSYGREVATIRRAMAQGKTSVDKGESQIIGVLRRNLEAMGLSNRVSNIFATYIGSGGTQSVKPPKKKTGGLIVPGAGDGDTVPLHVGGVLSAYVQPGELVSVANRRATSKILAANRGVPHRASGGLVEQALGPYSIPPIVYDPNHAGGNSHLHLDFFAISQALKYGHKLQGMGWSIGEYTPSPANPFGFGPITVQHQSPGHYDGTAFDANTVAGETKAQVSAVARLLNGGGGALGALAARVKLEKMPRFVARGSLGLPAADGLNATAAFADHAVRQILARRTSAAGERGASGPPPFKGGGRFVSTAYGPPWGGIQGTGVTATGVDLSGGQKDYGVAVDPGVIPLGARLRIWPNPFGYRGAFSAFDTGGAIQGNRIDFYDWLGRDDQNAWGVRDVSVKGYRRGGLIDRLAAGGGVAAPHSGIVKGLPSPRNALRRKYRLSRRIGRLDERIDLATREAALPRSPGGTEMTNRERLHIRGLDESLLGALEGEQGAIHKAMAKLREREHRGIFTANYKQRMNNLRDALVGIQGITGRGGRIFDTREAIAGLARPQRDLSQMSAQTSSFFDFIRTFSGLPFAGSFGGGGEVPGPRGAPRSAIVHGGEYVGERVPRFELRAFIGDRELKDVVLEVVETNDRGQRIAYRAGAGANA